MVLRCHRLTIHSIVPQVTRRESACPVSAARKPMPLFTVPLKASWLPARFVLDLLESSVKARFLAGRTSCVIVGIRTSFTGVLVTTRGISWPLVHSSAIEKSLRLCIVPAEQLPVSVRIRPSHDPVTEAYINMVCASPGPQVRETAMLVVSRV